ncbi:MAG: hypothetical protein AAFO75_06840, partial [Pseudomonadota bacterium]
MSDTVRRLAASTVFRFTIVVVAALSAIALVVSSIFLSQTKQSLTQQSVAGLRAEAEELVLLGERSGFEAVLENVVLRSEIAGRGLYFLGNGRGGKLAGNLPRFPSELEGRPAGGVFSYPLAGQEAPGGLAAGLVVAIDDARLVVARPA